MSASEKPIVLFLKEKGYHDPRVISQESDPAIFQLVDEAVQGARQVIKSDKYPLLPDIVVVKRMDDSPACMEKVPVLKNGRFSQQEILVLDKDTLALHPGNELKALIGHELCDNILHSLQPRPDKAQTHDSKGNFFSNLYTEVRDFFKERAQDRRREHQADFLGAAIAGKGDMMAVLAKTMVLSPITEVLNAVLYPAADHPPAPQRMLKVAMFDEKELTELGKLGARLAERDASDAAAEKEAATSRLVSRMSQGATR